MEPTNEHECKYGLLTGVAVHACKCGNILIDSDKEYIPSFESDGLNLGKKVEYYKKLLKDASQELGVANKAILKCESEWMDRGIKIGILEAEKQEILDHRNSIVGKYATLSDENKNLADEIKSVRAEHSQTKQDIEAAVQILNGYIYGNDVHNEAVNFVQAYFNKHNIFPYEP